MLVAELRAQAAMATADGRGAAALVELGEPHAGVSRAHRGRDKRGDDSGRGGAHRSSYSYSNRISTGGQFGSRKRGHDITVCR